VEKGKGGEILPTGEERRSNGAGVYKCSEEGRSRVRVWGRKKGEKGDAGCSLNGKEGMWEFPTGKMVQ